GCSACSPSVFRSAPYHARAPGCQALVRGEAGTVISHSISLVKGPISQRGASLDRPGHTPAVRRWLIVLIAAFGMLLPVAGGGATTQPRLRLLDTDPVAFRGIGFKAHERVRVVVYAGARAAKRATAGLRGGFVVRFADL